jgi:hypothetical protein
MRNTKLLFSTVVLALAISFSVISSAYATLIPVVASASNNATVQPAGPRAAPNGKNFFNLEGSSATTNSSFGVLDFSFSSLSLPGTATNVVGATLDLTESNAAFTNPGPLSIYLSTQTGVSIESTNTTLNYNGTNNGLASVDTDLGTLTLLGSGTFNTTGNTNNGSQDFYSMTFSGAALTSILNTLNTHGTLRLVMTPDAATTAATWSGFSGTASPSLGFFAVVPEPASCVLLGLGGLILAGYRARRGRQ